MLILGGNLVDRVCPVILAGTFLEPVEVDLRDVTGQPYELCIAFRGFACGGVGLFVLRVEQLLMEAVFMKRRLLKERITGCLCLLAIRDILLQLGESLFRKREFTRVIAHRECTDHGDGV